MKTTNYLSIYKRMMSACFAIILLSGCDQTNIEYTFPGSSDNPIGEPVAINISLQDFSGYNTTDKITGATRSEEPLISEYVKLKTFSLTRSPEEVENSKMIGIMELFTDTVPPSPQTRSTMADGNYFRLIMFRKVGSSYVFQTAADYTSNGTSAPVLNQGAMVAPLGHTYRIVGYSFNNKSSLGKLLEAYQWNVTSISIPDLSNDFLTFDSGDKTITNPIYSLPVTFSHQLCKLTVRVEGRRPGTLAITNNTGIYIKEGGKRSSWKIGAIGITGNTENPTPIDFPSNSNSVTTRIVPFASGRTITVHINTVIVEGNRIPDLELTSLQSVKLSPGKSYTMNVTLGTPLNIINVPASLINLGGTGCTDSDKLTLSKLSWAGGNLKSTDNNKPYDWAPYPESFGYYYTEFSSYTGNIDTNNIDPCTLLNPSIYGSGWRLPTMDEVRTLSRCTDSELTPSGMWFMNKTIGLLLPAAGQRSTAYGSGTSPNQLGGAQGFYRSDYKNPNPDVGKYGNSFCLSFYAGRADYWKGAIGEGMSVRCVK